MEKISKKIKTSVNDHVNDREFYQLFEEILKEQDLIKFQKDNQIKAPKMLDNAHLLMGYKIKNDICKKCQSLEGCQQTNKGYHPELFYEDETMKITNVPCSFQQEYAKEKNRKDHLRLYDVDEKLLEQELYTNSNRMVILGKIKKILMENEKKENSKGLYVYGTYGCGKTFILLSLAKSLADRGNDVVFVYYPDLVRKIKSAIGQPSFEQTIEDLKKAEVLMLDDFGGEMPNGYIRDEVLLPILQERMDYHRMTFMSSNLDPNQVLEHLEEGKAGIDKMRASRVWERMKVLMEWVELKDRNYR